MPLKDYECSGCAELVLDRLESTTASEPPPCPQCKAPMERLWLPAGRYAPFRAFTYRKDDGTAVRVDSMKALRDLERTSVSDWEQGRGAPLIFRDFSQDKSNLDQNVFQSHHPQVRAEELKAAAYRRGKRIIDVGAVDISVAERMIEEGE